MNQKKIMHVWICSCSFATFSSPLPVSMKMSFCQHLDS